jgi:ferrous iron transport protein B
MVDLQIPTILALNMVDLAAQAGMEFDIAQLQKQLDVPVVMINARTGSGLDELKEKMAAPLPKSSLHVYEPDAELIPILDKIQAELHLKSRHAAFIVLQQWNQMNFLPDPKKKELQQLAHDIRFFPAKYQGAETVQRYGFIQGVLNAVTSKVADKEWKENTYLLDRILTHKIWGYLIFLFILFSIFQSIFLIAQVPMDWIDQGFANLSSYLSGVFPDGPFFDLITQGIVPGIGGIVIFIPQIAILFAFISILEETGYMARVVFLMDKIMRKFGLNGKSVVPLISGWACAIPAIMATRTIDNWKDRLITIFVTPFMSCSARLPVFAIMVGLVVPANNLFWFINLQGIALMGLYLLGFVAAIGTALVMKMWVKTTEKSYLLMEMPTYRTPKWSNVGYTILEKTNAFVFEAGKVILAISIVLWVLASYGPGDAMQQAEQRVTAQAQQNNWSAEDTERVLAAEQLENSYAGKLGKFIEPAIRPLGYDWKIGIALITSFAAREVFVGTVSTIYSIGSTDDTATVKGRLKAEVNPETGGPRFTPAVGFSLLIFYTFAMQCMSTLAIVRRETKGWKWPAIQLAYMTGLAYLSALAVYQLMA